MSWDTYKSKVISEAKDNVNFFGNKEKVNREKQSVERLLNALKVPFSECDLKLADEPIDIYFKDARFQIKEILNHSRKRHDEYKEELNKVSKASNLSDCLRLKRTSKSPKNSEQWDSTTFETITSECYEYAQDLIFKQKYTVQQLPTMDCLIYYNKDLGVSASLNHSKFAPLKFRSLSVVSSRYCSVLYAHDDAPDFIQSSAGKIIEHIDI